MPPRNIPKRNASQLHKNLLIGVRKERSKVFDRRASKIAETSIQVATTLKVAGFEEEGIKTNLTDSNLPVRKNIRAIRTLLESRINR